MTATAPNDKTNGNLYVSDYGGRRFYLARPVAAGCTRQHGQKTRLFQRQLPAPILLRFATQSCGLHNPSRIRLVRPATLRCLAHHQLCSLPAAGLGRNGRPRDERRCWHRVSKRHRPPSRDHTASLTSRARLYHPSIVVRLRGLAAILHRRQNEPSLGSAYSTCSVPTSRGAPIRPHEPPITAEPLIRRLTRFPPQFQRPGESRPGLRSRSSAKQLWLRQPAVAVRFIQAPGTPVTDRASCSIARPSETGESALFGHTSFDRGREQVRPSILLPIFDRQPPTSNTALNTRRTPLRNRRQIRFYPLKTPNGMRFPTDCNTSSASETS